MNVIFAVWSLDRGDENLDIWTVEMSESRFRRSISQERMTEGWKGERNCMQKKTVGTVDIKTSLGGWKKRKERASRDSQTKEMCELRIGKDHGAKSGSRTAQAPPWGPVHDAGTREELKSRRTCCSCAWREAVNKGGGEFALVVDFAAELTN